MGTSAVKLSVKLSSANIMFVNRFGLNFPQILKTQKSFPGVFHKSSCSALNKALMKYLNLISSSSKLKSVTCKFTKSCILSQLFFKEFHYKCRTSISKNASWWLLLRATLFWKYYWTTAFQRQLQSIFILKILDYKYFTFLTLTSC